MSYVGESYKGKKIVSAFVAEGGQITLDNLIARVSPTTRRLQIKAVTGSLTVFGQNVFQQNQSIYNRSVWSATGLIVASTTFTELTPSDFLNFGGAVQKALIRVFFYSSNQGVYQITFSVGNGSNAAGFDRYHLMIERL